jgi:aldehyde:ferredoxin oxidoreductase
MLLLRGQAEVPSYLLLEDGKAKLFPADGLWGMNVVAAQEELQGRHGPGTVSAVIGPAGENRVRMAAIFTGKKNAAGRCGMGAVMGSKNLKAIAARGGEQLAVHDAAALRSARLEQTEQLKRSRVVQVMGTHGTPFLYEVSNRLGAIRTRNSQENTFSDSLNAEEIDKYSDKMLACTSCVVHCRHRNTLGGEGPEYSTIGLLGANIGLEPTEQVITLNNLVNELGLDASSTGTILAWAMELYQRGLIDDRQTGGPLRWGDFERIHELIQDIAHRRGFGDTLAESTQAKRFFPPEAADYLIAVKDLPQSDPHDVRYVKSFALGIAVASRGDHLRNRPTLICCGFRRSAPAVFSRDVDRSDQLRGQGGDGRLARDIYAVVDCLRSANSSPRLQLASSSLGRNLN